MTQDIKVGDWVRIVDPPESPVPDSLKHLVGTTHRVRGLSSYGGLYLGKESRDRQEVGYWIWSEPHWELIGEDSFVELWQ